MTTLPNELQQAILKKIFANFCPTAKVWMFGSRVTGKARPYADLDLLVKMEDAPIPLNIIFLLKDAFAESDLPFKVDLVDWHRTTEDFLKIIQPQLKELI